MNTVISIACLLILAMNFRPATAAERATLFLVGMDSERAFETEAERGSNVQKARGQNVLIAMGDGHPKFDVVSGMKTVVPLRTSADFAAALDVVKTINPDLKTLTIYIDDHGYWPSDYSDPASARVVLSDGMMSLGELGQIVNQKLKNDVGLKMVGTECFSGGIHELALRRPNTCSSSTTDFRTISHSTSLYDPYGRAFWRYFRAAGSNGPQKPNLFEAHRAAVSADLSNRNRRLGQLSSEAYMLKILKEDAFDPQLDANRGWLDRLLGNHDQSEGTEAVVKDCNADGCGRLEPAQALTNLRDAETQMSGISNKALQQLDPRLRHFITNNLVNAPERLKEFERGVATLHARWQRDEWEWAALTPKQQEARRAEFTARVEQVTEDGNKNLKPLLADVHLIEYASLAQRFVAKASPEQLKTVNALLACEFGDM